MITVVTFAESAPEAFEFVSNVSWSNCADPQPNMYAKSVSLSMMHGYVAGSCSIPPSLTIG